MVFQARERPAPSDEYKKGILLILTIETLPASKRKPGVTKFKHALAKSIMKPENIGWFNRAFEKGPLGNFKAAVRDKKEPRTVSQMLAYLQTWVRSISLPACSPGFV